jgi:hypothetical protein
MSLPQPPEGILDPKIPWSRINPNSRLWLILKARLTGRPQGDGYNYSSYVNITEAEADTLIANMKKDPRGYPSLDQESGTPPQWMERQRLYQEWLVEAYLENPFREEVDKKIEESAIERRLNEIQEERKKQSPPPVVVEEQTSPQEEETVEDDAQLAAEVVDESYNDANEKITDDILDDLPDSVKESLVNLINKRTGSNLTVEKKEKTGSVSNSKILKSLTTHLQKIQGQLSTIDSKLQEQNSLLRGNLYTSLQNISQLEYQDDVLSKKLDALLEAYKKQAQFAEEEADRAEDKLAESRLEQTKDAAFTEGFKDVSGLGGGGILGRLFSKLAKFLGRKLFNKIWKLLPKGLRSRVRLARKILSPKNIKRALGSKVARFLGGRLASTATKAGASAAPRAIAKGFEHIALPGVTRNIDDVGKIATSKAGKEALTNMLGPAGKMAISQLAEPKSGFKVAMSAINNAKVRAAIVKRGGQELLQKVLTKAGIKVGGQAIPVVGQALNLGYGLVEGITRTAMGDPKGGLLSLGGAIPLAGAGFSVIDIIRDIDTAAYTKHIEPNLGSIATGDGKPIASFFNEVAGEQLQYEQGGLTQPGDAVLHGREMILPNGENPYVQLMNPVAGALISASSKFINQAGPAAAMVAPVFKQTANKLSEVFDVPTTLAQTNVGGSYSGLDAPIKSVKKKGEKEKEKDGDEIEMSESEKKIFEDANQQTGGFVDKLRRFFGIRYSGDSDENQTPTGEYSSDDVGEGDGELRFGLTGRTAMSAGGWSHAHFEAQDGNINTLVKDVVPLVKKMASLGLKPELSDGTPIEKDKDNAYYDKLIRKGQARHTHSGPKAAVDVNMPGFPKVPFKLTDVRNTPKKGEGVNGLVPGSGKTALYHLSYKTDGYKDGGETPGVPTVAIVGEAGKEIVMKNLVATSPARPLLLALNDAETHKDVIESVREYAPEILMYDTEEQANNNSIIMMPMQQQSDMQMPPMQRSIDPYKLMREQKMPATKTLILQSLYL